jgi:hypothetical protein
VRPAAPPRPSRRWIWICVLLAVAALVLRLALLAGPWSQLRHGSAADLASVALGLVQGEGISTQPDEVAALAAESRNLHGDYKVFHRAESRRPYTFFLPGTGLVLAGLWTLTGVHNYAPYLVMMSLLDVLAIALLLHAGGRRHPLPFLSVALLLAFDPIRIKHTLTAGYDAWPHFMTLMVLVLLVEARFAGRVRGFTLGLALVMLPLGVWSRDLAAFLPPVVLGALLLLPSTRRLLAANGRLVLALGVATLALGALSWQRARTTDNAIPVRTVFWHSFFAGVGQFDNPYGLRSDDREVWELARRLNPALLAYRYDQIYTDAWEEYNGTLKAEALRLAREEPMLLLAGVVKRTGLILAPSFHDDGRSVSAATVRRMQVLSWIWLVLVAWGIAALARRDRLLLWLLLAVVGHFVLMFSWFYVVGRVLICVLPVDALLVLFGLRELAERWGPAGALWRRAEQSVTGRAKGAAA